MKVLAECEENDSNAAIFLFSFVLAVLYIREAVAVECLGKKPLLLRTWAKYTALLKWCKMYWQKHIWLERIRRH